MAKDWKNGPDADAEHADWLKDETADVDFMSVADVSLLRYLRQLGTIPVLTEERRAELTQDILETEQKWRTALYQLASCGEWHRNTVNSWDLTQLHDHVMPSCLGENTTPADLQRWREELPLRIAALRQAFEAKDPNQLAAERKNLLQHLLKYKLTSNVVMRFHEALDKMLHELCPECLSEAAGLSCMDEAGFQEIIKQANAARTHLWALRQEMVESNLRLVIRIVNQYSSRKMSVCDLVQEGNIGLMRSLERFDFSLGYKFSTYAGWWIRQSIGRALAEQFRVIRIPLHMISTIAAINRAEQRFILEHDRLPEVSEIAAILEMPVARVSAIRKMARQSISLQSPLSSDDSGNRLEDVLPDERTPGPTQALMEESKKQQLELLLGQLSEREREILIMRFGLLGRAPCTLQEISDRFHVSRERVRQLTQNIINKLRTPENQKMFGSGSC